MGMERPGGNGDRAVSHRLAVGPGLAACPEGGEPVWRPGSGGLFVLVVRAKGQPAGSLLPLFDLLPVVLRSAFQPAVPAGDPYVGSAAAQFGAAAAEDAAQLRHANTSSCCGVMRDTVGWAAGTLAGCF